MPMRTYDHVLSFALTHPWAVEPETLSIIGRIIGQRVAGLKASEEDIAAALVNRQNLPQATSGGGYAVIPVYGVIAPRMNMLSEMSGGATFEGLSNDLQKVMANKAVKTIVFDINSPGGNVAGATEFAREVMAARTKKAIIAQIQHTGASAAYWFASAATQVYASPSSQIGSIGIYAAHDDISEALAKLGVKRTYLSAGEGKVDGLDTALSAEAKARMLATIEDAYGRMVGDIVKGRGKGMTAERVRTEWKAHLYPASQALSLGLIDGIATLDETIARIATGTLADTTAAQANPPHDTAQEPVTVTAQDRAERIRHQNALESAVLEFLT